MPEAPALPPPLEARRPRVISRWGRVQAVAVALGVSPVRLVLGAAAAVIALAVAGYALATHGVGTAGPPTEANLPRASTVPRDATGDHAAGPVVVAAAGAVAHPGVYRLAAGARVIDVIQAAGGPTADADTDRVNLAAKVTDGERVYVPRRGEVVDVAVGVGSSAGSTAGSVVVDLNTATAEQLESLPGVGPATAKAILEYRVQHGRFRSVNDLLAVRGIGEAKLEQLKPHVRVS